LRVSIVELIAKQSSENLRKTSRDSVLMPFSKEEQARKLINVFLMLRNCE
jgi:hypothetical protein